MKKLIKSFFIIAVVILIGCAAGTIINPESRFYEEIAARLISITQTLNKSDSEEFAEVDTEDLKNEKNCIFNQSLMLVNKSTPLPDDFQPELVRYETTDAFLNKYCNNSFVEMREYLQNKFGERLLIMSAYRDRTKQSELYEDDTDGITAKPGESEHETGLGIDVYVKYFAGKAFIESDVGRYVNKHCGNFGFIIRYPLGEENITGFSYEPWHIRYVGLPHSKIIQSKKLTLEEYLENLEIGCFYEYENYIISKQCGEKIKIPKQYKQIVISPDNQGNYIVTVELS